MAPGETLALVGESGSGKSVTALSLLQLLNYPTAFHPAGQIVFEGRDLMGATDEALRSVRGNRISMVFQEPMTSLNPLHTIADTGKSPADVLLDKYADEWGGDLSRIYDEMSF